MKERERDPENQARIEAKWGKKGQRDEDFKVGRDGDSILIPFECDTCIFHKLRHCEPNPKSDMDQLMLACIRRMNLDAFWSSSSFTVKGNKDKVKQMLKYSSSIGLTGAFV